MKQTAEKLINAKYGRKVSKYVHLKASNPKYNTIVLKKVLDDIELSSKSILKITSYANQVDSNPSLAFFIDKTEKNGDVLFHALPLEFPHKGEYLSTNYFVIPLFDFRYELFKKLYLLSYSQNSIELYSLSKNKLKKVKLKSLTLEKFNQSRYVNKSMQHHTASHSTFHGQNASSEKDKENELIEMNIQQLSEEVNSVLSKHKGKLIIASTDENVGVLSNFITSEHLTNTNLIGNSEHLNPDQLLSKVKDLIDKNSDKYLNRDYSIQVDVEKSNKLAEESFVDIVSAIKANRVEKLLIGKLNKQYKNENLDVLGINYLVHEVVDKGGDVSFYPNAKFSFNDDNIAFKLRY